MGSDAAAQRPCAEALTSNKTAFLASAASLWTSAANQGFHTGRAASVFLKRGRQIEHDAQWRALKNGPVHFCRRASNLT